LQYFAAFSAEDVESECRKAEIELHLTPLLNIEHSLASTVPRVCLNPRLFAAKMASH
jgi:hypothetical protein